MASRLFMSEDTGAPVLTGGNGSLIEILRAVLVDGYGSTASLGWTMPFSDIPNNKAVFRMPAGSERYIQIEDIYYKSAYVFTYSSMTDVDTGMLVCPSYGETMNGLNKSQLNDDTTEKLWRIIGDDRGFYFINGARSTVPYVETSGTVNDHIRNIHYIGDFVPFSRDRKNLFCVQLQYNATDDDFKVYPVSNFLTSNQGAFLPTNKANEPQVVGFGYTGYSPYNYDDFGNSYSSKDVFGSTIYLPIHMHSESEVIGMLPGFMNPLKVTFGQPSEIIKETILTDATGIIGFEFTTGRISSNTQAQSMMIIIGEGFRYVR